jgi:hypothetical protein
VERQLDSLAGVGIPDARIYVDKKTGAPPSTARA